MKLCLDYHLIICKQKVSKLNELTYRLLAVNKSTIVILSRKTKY